MRRSHLGRGMRLSLRRTDLLGRQCARRGRGGGGGNAWVRGLPPWVGRRCRMGRYGLAPRASVSASGVSGRALRSGVVMVRRRRGAERRRRKGQTKRRAAQQRDRTLHGPVAGTDKRRYGVFLRSARSLVHSPRWFPPQPRAKPDDARRRRLSSQRSEAYLVAASDSTSTACAADATTRAFEPNRDAAASASR